MVEGGRAAANILNAAMLARSLVLTLLISALIVDAALPRFVTSTSSVRYSMHSILTALFVKQERLGPVLASPSRSWVYGMGAIFGLFTIIKLLQNCPFLHYSNPIWVIK